VTDPLPGLEAIAGARTSAHAALERNAEAMESLAERAKPGCDKTLWWAHVLGQSCHESGGFSRVEENLNYSAAGLRKTWPTRFALDAERYARDPKAIANKAYGGRMGNDASGDGWRYRGRGWIQLTGRENYARAERFLASHGLEAGLLDDPDKAAEPGTAWMICAWYMTTAARRGESIMFAIERNDARLVTRMVNGGTHGLKERKRLTEKALEAMRAAEPEAPKPAAGSAGESGAPSWWRRRLGF